MLTQTVRDRAVARERMRKALIEIKNWDWVHEPERILELAGLYCGGLMALKTSYKKMGWVKRIIFEIASEVKAEVG